jgi:hypothetical protein
MGEDLFESYYAEKLWEMIPAIYRHEDGLAENPGVLRAMVQVMAKQAAILRRSQDRLWEDEFIEWCSEWAVPYIGDLVATRLLSALNKRGRRVDVAKTIYYRRRKGTPRILEELISDISGWEGKMVEQFQKLVRSRHGLDPFPEKTAGRFSGTLPGGIADLRNPRISELADGPFEEYFHTADTRKHRGLDGRYAIPKLAFYLYRLRSFRVDHVTPFSLGNGQDFTFDPSGRDLPLFSQRLRSDDWDKWHSAMEWELPAPIPCRLLAHAEYVIDGVIIQELLNNGLSVAAASELKKLTGLRFKSESGLFNIINTFSNKADILNPVHYLRLIALALVPDCGKQVLLPDDNTIATDPLEESSIIVGFEPPSNTVVSAEQITAGNLLNWSANSNKTLVIDPEHGRFRFTAAPDPLLTTYSSYHYGFSGNIGAGTYTRSCLGALVPANVKSGGGAITATDLLNDGVAQISDNKTYGPVSDKLSIRNMSLYAGNQQRPYIRLQSDWVLSTGANQNSTLTLDGCWFGSTANTNVAIILRGNYERVTIKDCTIDPGGSSNANGETILPVTLRIEGFIETLCIQNSISGPVILTGGGIVEQVFITDSIIQSVDPAIKAIDITQGKTDIERTTVFGELTVHELYASELLLTGLGTVKNTQEGCFRFSAAPRASKLPRPYESFLFHHDSNHWFSSRRFGDPGYAQLSDTAPAAIARGAGNGSEMGAFSNLLNPIKFDGLRTKIDEYMPFGLIPIFINRT